MYRGEVLVIAIFTTIIDNYIDMDIFNKSKLFWHIT